MTLEEMEQIAHAVADGRMSYETQRVARALLAVLPVVRAAEEWRDTRGPYPTSASAAVLYDAIDQMRAEFVALKEK